MSRDNKVRIVKGYKVFNPDWTCKGFKYEVGKSYEMGDNIKCCIRGFHFCTRLADCFIYYSSDSNNKVAEVEAYGKIDYSKEDTKACTNKIKIVREIPWSKVVDMARSDSTVNIGTSNTGKCNIGNYNTGDYNNGSYNTGTYNKGDYNSNDFNIGDFNSGMSNRGCYNAGQYNEGSCNAGNNNIGNHNTGNYNITNYSSGWFCVKEPKVMLFDKPTNMTYREWESTRAYDLLCIMPEWYDINEDYIVDRIIVYNERQKWYNNLPSKDKDIIKSIPNFDADIFEQCTGIDVNKDK